MENTWTATFGGNAFDVGESLVANGNSMFAPVVPGSDVAKHPVVNPGRITKVGYFVVNNAGTTVGIYVSGVLQETFSTGAQQSGSIMLENPVVITVNQFIELRREAGGNDPGICLFICYVNG